MAKMGLTFADIVQAHVFLVGDPDNGGKMDFMGMNRAWSKEFGTPEQPNKPARAAFQISSPRLPRRPRRNRVHRGEESEIGRFNAEDAVVSQWTQ